MIRFILILTSLFPCDRLLAQHTNICFKKNQVYSATYSLDTAKLSQTEATKFISRLMTKIDLPMNFNVIECDHNTCKENAFASMDVQGNRAIVFDSDWLSSLNTDSKKHESLVILAHEIGHHLAGHSLALNYLAYEDAYSFCNPSSLKYNKSICQNTYQNDYSAFLRKSRTQELEADRFTGFISQLYGISLIEVLNTFRKITTNYDDSFSTHPTLDKRLAAAEAGFKLALNYQKLKSTNYDLQKIKGREIKVEITNKTAIERNALISKIREAISFTPIAYILNTSDLDLEFVSGTLDKNVVERLVDFHKNTDSPHLVDEPNFYFESQNIWLNHKYTKEVYYIPNSAIFIQNKTLQVLTFNTDPPRVVYRSYFDENSVSLNELEIIFTEIIENGLIKSIEKHNKGKR